MLLETNQIPSLSTLTKKEKFKVAYLNVKNNIYIFFYNIFISFKSISNFFIAFKNQNFLFVLNLHLIYLLNKTCFDILKYVNDIKKIIDINIFPKQTNKIPRYYFIKDTNPLLINIINFDKLIIS